MHPFFMSINKQLLKAQKYLRTGSYIKAIEILNKYLKTSPEEISALMLRGEAFLRGEQFESALTDYAKVIERDNKNILALNNFSIALIRCNKYNDAKEIIAYVHELDPNNFPAYINSGNIHQALGEYKEAINSAMSAVQQDPKSSLAYVNLGSALGGIRLFQEAKQAFLMANFYDPKNIYIKINLAQIEEKLGNIKDAKLMYEQILQLNYLTPLESNLVKYYLSYIYLALGQLKQGWDFYEYGFSKLLPPDACRSRRVFSQPAWTGNADERKPILVWREQGVGDEILFSTCLGDMHDLNLNIILECDPRLVAIYQRTYPKFRVRKESMNTDFTPQFDDFDYQIAIGSLPRYFRRNIGNFDTKPYLWKPLPESVSLVKVRLAPYKHKILIGICWRSAKLSIERNLNYTALQDWTSLLSNPNYQFVNLLHGDCEAEINAIENSLNIQILRWSDINLKDDLETVLALTSELDCVVSIGSAVSVIAASAGVNTLVLLQRSWVLLGNSENYPWYPNVRAFTVEVNEHVGINIKSLDSYIVKKSN
ncbi:GT9_LPS_heptosyltransferase domain containing protein [Burkholderiaceae bacterium]